MAITNRRTGWGTALILASVTTAAGLVFAIQSWPLVTGQEELTLWSEVTFSSHTAMNFMRPLLIALLGSIYSSKYKAHWWSWLILAGGIIGGVSVGWWQYNFSSIAGAL